MSLVWVKCGSLPASTPAFYTLEHPPIRILPPPQYQDGRGCIRRIYCLFPVRWNTVVNICQMMTTMKYSNCCFDISIVDDARARQQLYRASKDIEYWYRPEINSISQMHHIRQFSQHTFFDHSNRSNLTQFSVCHLPAISSHSRCYGNQ